ncbi:MAG: PAS domain S-box protein [Gemmatimonadaceae bacterium]|nr:PAS domain S-box protein [Gemmatimonadaceae bacterium]
MTESSPRITPVGLADPFGVIEYAPEGFVLLDREFRILYENPAACRMLGLDRATVRGRTIWECVPALATSPFGELARTAMREQRVITATAPAVSVPRWFSVKAYPTQDGLAVYYDDVTERQDAMRALQEREERLQLVIGAADVGIWDADLRTGVVFASDELRQLYGLPSHVVDLPSFRAVLHRDDIDTVDRLAAEALPHGGSWRARVRIHRADTGALRWVELLGKSYVAADGTPLRSIGTARDITDEQTKADDLLHAQRDLQRAQSMARIGTWSWDLRTDVTRWSPEIWAIFEFPPTQAPSIAALNDLYPADELARWRAAVEQTFATGQPFEIELRTTLPSGRGLEVWALGEVVADAEGRPVELFGTVQDVTEARAQARALAESERRFRVLSEAAPLGIFVTDAEGRTVYANPALLALFEQTLEQFHAGEWIARVHPDDRPGITAESGRAIAARQSIAYSYRIVRSDGVRHVRISTKPLPPVNGAYTGQVGMVEDITLQVQAAEEARRLEARERETQKLESLGLLAGGIAHDFNNLLVGVLTNASLALLDLADGHAARDAIEDIERAAQRAADLTRQLLAYAGKGRYVVEPVDLSALVREMAQLLRAAIARKVSLRLDLADHVPPVLGDATQLRQVVMNLITNASDAMLERGGDLVVRTTVVPRATLGEHESAFGSALDGDPRIVVEVRDQGHGMTPDVIERIFDPFFTTKFTGRGLGLSATVGILRQHGGTISVTSVPDVGTTFRLWFVPRPGAVTPSAPAAPAIPDLAVGGTILIVDDDEGVRHVARTLLQRRGFTVLLAEDGREGLERFRAAGDDLRGVLLDLTMPVMGGAEALAAMRVERPDVPVLLMSGYTEHELQQTFAGRASGFLQKPFRAQELYAAIGAMLEPTPR